jgi:hypothetical protein
LIIARLRSDLRERLMFLSQPSPFSARIIVSSSRPACKRITDAAREIVRIINQDGKPAFGREKFCSEEDPQYNGTRICVRSYSWIRRMISKAPGPFKISLVPKGESRG